MFDHLGDFWGDHRFPGRVVVLDSFQHVARENMQNIFIVIVELLDPSALHQVAVEAVQVARHLYIIHGAKLARGLVSQGINVDPQIFGEQLPECFENSTFE